MIYLAIIFNVTAATLTLTSVVLNYNDDYFRALLSAFLFAVNIACLIYNIRGLMG